MAKQGLETMRRMLQISSQAQLLFDGERMVAASSSATRLFPEAREGATAEDIFGPAVEQYRQFSGNGSLLFTVNLADFFCDVTVAACDGYLLATAVQPWETMGMNTMLSISEGVRQPMTTILSITPKLLPLLEETSDPKAMDRAAELNRSLYSILRITGNLQMYGIANGSITMRMVRTDLDAWMQNLMDRIVPLCSAANRNLVYQNVSGRCFCSLDTDRMERVLLNLISNAMKFTDPGGTISVSLRRSEQRLFITVRDNGCGIPADQMSVVFNRSEHRGRFPDPRWGIGMGLPISKGIVQAHGGRMMLESEEGVGTTVHIALDVQADSDACILRSPVKLPDYSGGIDHVLLELADALPAKVFDTRGVDL